MLAYTLAVNIFIWISMCCMLVMLSVSFSASLCYTPLLFVYDSGFAELKLIFLQVFCLKESEMKSRVTIYCLLGIMLVEIIQ